MTSKKPDASEVEIEPSTEDPEPEITAGNGADADTDAMRPWSPAVANSMEDFDFNTLRLPQDFDQSFGAKPVLTGIDVRKPKGTEWVRVHSSPDFRRLLGVTEVAGDLYVVHQDLAPVLGDVVKPKLLAAAVNNRGIPFLWPLRRPAPDGRRDGYMDSENIAADRARDYWVRVVSNQHARRYDLFDAAAGKIPDPEWPQIDFATWLQLAFSGRVIKDLNHPLVRMLLTGAE
jgi:hypothetical protein